MPSPFPASSQHLLYFPVEESDFDELLSVYNSNPDYMEYAYGKREVTVQTVESDHAENLAMEDSYSILLRSRSTRDLVGIAQFILRNPRDGNPWLGLIMLHKDHQGKGYAQHFLDTLIAWYKENGYTSLHLGVLDKNRGVVPFYEKCGFRVYEERMTEKLGLVICMAYDIK
ncbi:MULTISPECIES: GNAT family N-acetyltransferase [Brevibacillus]|jgi:RimJ/RimL family protein N-acetyltransferase|uniref:N-acetyltransferase GCN5 n=1 Tax=Brevibacillus borstelensis AK1 TaxID=1300222 RepID=M8E3I8_9BACL|nr:GNAT family N-acetyltransferase [Brevibacillus borstelensis]EMT53851.1 N-acetyltransferase GCN5 [Brevibacillus borstelensis AK1]KKX56748.1 sortase [Brevibacillus borstelensis cifa_chp40]MBE5395710.1 GNAT family N-acetyltransferase [Brevibacillus borstelensis]MCC0565618.1 GNAT family N-acetyltransferase [Brevibacillus borstelensis]MCM3470903.1 GNAT family N-acetyltransferase [Brevibacillus borstelensis]